MSPNAVKGDVNEATRIAEGALGPADASLRPKLRRDLGLRSADDLVAVLAGDIDKSERDFSPTRSAHAHRRADRDADRGFPRRDHDGPDEVDEIAAIGGR